MIHVHIISTDAVEVNVDIHAHLAELDGFR